MVLIKSPKECKERKASSGLAVCIVLFLTCLVYLSRNTGTNVPNIIKRDQERYLRKLMGKEQFQCRGWHTTRGLEPFNVYRFGRYLQHSLLGQPGISCYDDIPGDESGYCEILDTKTGSVVKAYTQDYNKLTFRQEQLQEPFLRCAMAADFMNIQNQAEAWKPTEPLIDEDNATPSSSQRGIVMKIDRETLPGVYANLQLLRNDHGCTLPIELWMNGGEDGVDDSIFDHPILQLILEDPLIKVKFHWDWRYEGANNLLYGAAYSTFDEVLLLDSGSFPIRDPSFLFEDPQYKEKGSLFWKSLWSNTGLGPQKMAKKRKSILTALSYKEHQSSPPNLEAAQMLINRRACAKQMRLLLFMTGYFPDGLKKFGVPHDIQDLVPVVWEMAGAELGLVEQVPDIVGIPRSLAASYAASQFLSPLNYISQRATQYYRLCGLSMIHLDTQGQPLFINRPNAPLSKPETLEYKVWGRAVTFLANMPNAQFDQVVFSLDYNIKTGQDFHEENLGEDGRGLMCSFPKLEPQESFRERPLAGTDISRLEDTLIGYAREVHVLADNVVSSW